MLDPELIIIAAMSRNGRVIGREGQLPWHKPKDLARFKRLTQGHHVLMGRTTYECALEQNGGPLPDRQTLVLTRSQRTSDHDNVTYVGGLEEAIGITLPAKRLFIAGGETVYKQFLTFVDRWELTYVDADVDGDAYFPEHRNKDGFQVVERDYAPGLEFVTYVRTKPSAPIFEEREPKKREYDD